MIEANEKSLKVLYNMLGLGLGSGLAYPGPNPNQVLYNMYAAADGKNASTG